MSRLKLATVLSSAVAIIALVVGLAPSRLGASSHREAPLISKDAFADNTDTYVFIPKGQTNRIVLAASWIPFEGPEGGPNYWEWDDSARYYIYVDNDGDAVADVTYTLSSRVDLQNPNTFLYNTGPITSLTDPDWNRRQRITVTETFAGGATTVLVNDKLTAPVNIGSKSTPNYAELAKKAIYKFDPDNGAAALSDTADGAVALSDTAGAATLSDAAGAATLSDTASGTAAVADTANDDGDEIFIFGGQTDDPFMVDLQVFDLLTLRGQAPPVGYSTGNNRPTDSVSGYNVHSLVLEIPISRLTQGGGPVLGVWAATSRPTTRVHMPGGQTNTGDQVQVSRLGMPLVNEVVIPLALKDAFNGLAPQNDLTTYVNVDLLQKSVEDPEVGTLLCALYGVPLPDDSNDDCHTEFTDNAAGSGRGDIVQIFLTGMVLVNPFTINTASGPVTLPAGFNVNQPAGVQPAEMIRINTVISGTLCAPTPSRLGVLGGDACGFPNGRRLTDDVVDIELLAVAGAAYQVLDGTETGFAFNTGLIDVLADRVDKNDISFRSAFPYMAFAQSGQSHTHHKAGR